VVVEGERDGKEADDEEAYDEIALDELEDKEPACVSQTKSHRWSHMPGGPAHGAARGFAEMLRATCGSAVA